MNNQKFFVVSIVVLILSTVIIALPNLVGAQGKAKTAALRGTLRTIQIMLDAYSTDHGGGYPKNIHEFHDAITFLDSRFWLQGYYLRLGSDPESEPEPLKIIFLSSGDPKDWLKAKGNGARNYIVFCDSGDGYCFMATDQLGRAVPGIGGEPLILSNY